MDRQEIRDLSRKRLGETTAAFWTDPELNQWIDNAGHNLAYITKYIKLNGYIDTTSAQEYTLSSYFPNWLSVLKVYLLNQGDTWWKLRQTDEDKLDRDSDGWRSAPASTPYRYYQDKERDILGLYPKADSANQGSSYLHVFYSNDFTDLTVDDVDLTMPFELQLAVVDFVVATGYETRGWGDKANDAWGKYSGKARAYMVERDTEKEEDEEALLMKNYRNK